MPGIWLWPCTVYRCLPGPPLWSNDLSLAWDPRRGSTCRSADWAPGPPWSNWLRDKQRMKEVKLTPCLWHRSVPQLSVVITLRIGDEVSNPHFFHQLSQLIVLIRGPLAAFHCLRDKALVRLETHEGCPSHLRNRDRRWWKKNACNGKRKTNSDLLLLPTPTSSAITSQCLAPCLLLTSRSCATSFLLQVDLLIDGWRKFCQKNLMSSADFVPSN